MIEIIVAGVTGSLALLSAVVVARMHAFAKETRTDHARVVDRLDLVSSEIRADLRETRSELSADIRKVRTELGEHVNGPSHFEGTY